MTKKTVATNFVFIIEELKKILDKERNQLVEQVFKKMITDKKLFFFLITDKGSFTLPSRIKARSNKQLVRNDNTPIKKSLFDYVPEENIYPDFIATDKDESKNDYGTIYVLETKGIHLKNEDTKYKQDVFALCNELGAKKAWKELFDEFPDRGFEFQVIFEDEWQNKLNGLII
ncbi:hypothetical protein Barb7_00250 [Bacteroidales bacterium Barb7]|nr:hypothetical protein Barb7_00250 [Bacteroidales bacterium Barb7]